MNKNLSASSQKTVLRSIYYLTLLKSVSKDCFPGLTEYNHSSSLITLKLLDMWSDKVADLIYYVTSNWWN
jgi:hypothetical protein